MKNELARSILENHAILPENKRLMTDIRKLEADMSSREWPNLIERAETAEARLHDLQLDHWQRTQSAQEKAETELRQYAASWRRANEAPAAERLLQRERLKVQLAISDKREIAAMVSKALEADSPEARQSIDGDMLYAAAEWAMTHSDNDLLLTAKEAIRTTNSDAPWLNTEKGAELAHEADIYSCEYGLCRMDPEAAGDEVAFDVAEVIDLGV